MPGAPPGTKNAPEQKYPREKIEPVADLVEQWKSHVPCPDLQWNEIIAEGSDKERHDDEEDHDRGVHGHEHVIATRDNRTVGRHRRRQQMADHRHRCVGPGELVTNEKSEPSTE